MPGYDRFRTGLDFASVQQMLRVESDDPTTWRQKSRGVVLGLWHSIKKGLWEMAQEQTATGKVERLDYARGGRPCNQYRVTNPEAIRAVRLEYDRPGHPDWYAIVHPSTHEIGRWQVTYFDRIGAMGDTRRDTLQECLNASWELQNMWRIVEVV
jgi:hypothetical protein